MKTGNYKLKDVELDKSYSEKKICNKNPELKNVRNYGIDLLRIYSMINVVILHSLKIGKIISSNRYSKNYYSASLLETFCFSAVNTFGMISGYAMINMKFNGFKIILLWFHIFFYQFIFLLRDSWFYKKKKLNNMTKRDILFSLFFPAITKSYWYYTCYFCMYFLFLLLINLFF